MFTKLLTAAAVATLAAAPVMAAPAAKLSLSRASTAGEKESNVASAAIIGVIATVAIVAGAVVVADNGDDDSDSN
ncbi:hypothetical protein LQ953_00540 [Sphingomonas sp. IC-56]|uniref:hypothetical protein n=1 Tax=Sphingomonas sp. IC-56 TaxID=2898529 RepID=UPI001E55766F|nr:hypothetical protein [Sphingomonas sp. IC-56]MCD2322499.1 hypothetical protein [Sphingomonas sp. IC-56]